MYQALEGYNNRKLYMRNQIKEIITMNELVAYNV